MSKDLFPMPRTLATFAPFVVGAMFVLFVAETSAFAQTTPPPALAATNPRELVARGDRLRRLHLYEAALVEYQNAAFSAPTPSTLRRIGEVQRELGDLEGAAASFDKVLAAKDASREDRRLAEKGVASLVNESGTIAVNVSNEGAAIKIDDRPLGGGVPKPQRANAGFHVIRVSKEGFEPFATTVDVAAGSATTVNVALLPVVTTGTIFVREKKGTKVRITVDGKDAGSTPFRGELTPGEHVIEIATPKLVPSRTVAKVELRERTEIEVEAKSTVGAVDIRPEPPSAEVLVDGQPAPESARHPFELLVGTHRFEARAAGFDGASESLEVAPGSSSTWAPQLRRTVDVVEPKGPDYSGGHFDIGVHGGALLAGAVDVCSRSGATMSTCDAGSVLGGGLVLSGGYNFGIIGFDVTALPSAHYGGSTLSYDGTVTAGNVPEAAIAHTEAYRVFDAGGVVGIGPSIATHGTFARVSGSVVGGVAARFVLFDRQMGGGIQESSTSSDVVVGPAGAARFSLLLGSTPGAKFQLGALMTMEMLNYATAATNTQANGTSFTVPAYDVFKDVQLYIGPEISVRFGY